MLNDEISSVEETAKMQKTDPSLARIKKLPLSEIEVDDALANTPPVYPKSASRASVATIGKKERKQTSTASAALKSLTEEARLRRMQCKQLGISVFFQDDHPMRSLGFTSAIHGEGKSFLANLTAQVLTEDSNIPVTLLECNWENPSFIDAFDLAPGPGLAEWLRGECRLDSIRQRVSSNLTVIPAGDPKNNSITLLQEFRLRGVLDILTKPEEVVIVDLPSLITTDYGQIAAKLVDTLVLVVRMGVTPDTFVTEACRYLKEMRVQGIILNQITSRLPQWLRQTL